MYRRPHRLARALLSILGFDPTEEPRRLAGLFPPFCIDMNELFERYCETLLRRNPNYRDNLVSGYHRRNIGAEFTVAPLAPIFRYHRRKGQVALEQADIVGHKQAGLVEEQIPSPK